MGTHTENSPDTETLHVRPPDYARYRVWQQAAQTLEERHDGQPDTGRHCQGVV